MATEKADGGAAFPTHEFRQLGPGGAGHMVQTGGMSLRDWFAGQSLMAMLSNNVLLDSIDAASPTIKMVPKLAHHSYEIADAMLAERSKGAQ